mmetsp:Transcript_83123/g.235483  ORF Transcript_83123/g.235483 Transcript_83123/m.235483 type:complete len:218 (-) Transcript_83123:286-939(-)
MDVGRALRVLASLPLVLRCCKHHGPEELKERPQLWGLTRWQDPRGLSERLRRLTGECFHEMVTDGVPAVGELQGSALRAHHPAGATASGIALLVRQADRCYPGLLPIVGNLHEEVNVRQEAAHCARHLLQRVVNLAAADPAARAAALLRAPQDRLLARVHIREAHVDLRQLGPEPPQEGRVPVAVTQGAVHEDVPPPLQRRDQGQLREEAGLQPRHE